MAKRTENRIAKRGNKLEKHITGKSTVVDEDKLINKDAVEWDVQQGEVHSEARLEEDTGEGKAVVIRAFDFAANPKAFKEKLPTSQELFNAHKNQIYGHLLSDSLTVYEEVSPKILISKNKKFYRIYVAALPLSQASARRDAKTLTQVFNGDR